jgi:hypothetical protein
MWTRPRESTGGEGEESGGDAYGGPEEGDGSAGVVGEESEGSLLAS